MQSQPLNDQNERVAPIGPEDWPEPPLHAPPRVSGFHNDQRVSKRSSFGRRMFRLFIAALIGAGATLAWQSYGDEAKAMIITWAPSLGGLLSVSTKSPANDQVSAQGTALPQSAPAAAAVSPEVMQQLEPMARDLSFLRRSIEQLAAKQEQMAQNIATLQTVEQDIKQRVSSPPPSRAVPIPPRKPPQPAAQSSALQSSSVPPPPPHSQPPLPLR